MNDQNKSRALSTKRLLLKFAIAFGFFTLFAGVLYLPRILDVFGSQTSLNIYTFTEMLSPEVAQRFEDETGVAVNIKFFQTNEELYAKLRVNLGEGYDIIVASEYMIETMKNEGILQKLDHSKLAILQELDPKLLNQPFDPGNQYSLPLEWHTYGIVYDKALINSSKTSTNTNTIDEISFDLLFKDPRELLQLGLVKNLYKICMVDDGKEALMLALLYLFGGQKPMNEEAFVRVEQLLIQQKEWVEAYTSSSLQYFLFTDIVPVAVTSSSYMKKILEETDRFGFKIPKEGGILVLENYAIPISCKKVDLVHQFFNFVLSQENVEFNSDKYGYNPTNKKAYAAVPERFLNDVNIFPDEKTFERLHILRQEYPPKKKIENTWLGVKFA